LPPQAAGAMSAVSVYNNTAMRVVMQYNSTTQGMQVTVDSLFGTKTLDSNLGCVLLG